MENEQVVLKRLFYSPACRDDIPGLFKLIHCCLDLIVAFLTLIFSSKISKGR